MEREEERGIAFRAANKPVEYHYHAATREHAYFGIEFQRACTVASAILPAKLFARVCIPRTYHART